MGSPAWELTDIELPFPVASMDAVPGGDAVSADAGFLIYPQAGVGSEPLFVSSAEVRYAALELVSAAMNLIPYFGQIKGLVEAAAGKDLVSGRNLAAWERVLNAASAIPHLHGATGITKVVVQIGHVTHQVNIGIHVKHAVDVHQGPLGQGQGGGPTAPAQGGGDPLQTGTGRMHN